MSRCRLVLAALLPLAVWPLSLVNAAEPACFESQESTTRHAFIAADSSKGIIAWIDEAGEVVWERKIGPLHDLHLLANGNVLFQDSWTHLLEVDPRTDQVVWEHDSAAGSKSSSRPERSSPRVEVHAFQRLMDGGTLIAESGRSRLIEVDRQGELRFEVALSVDQPDPHHDTRLVRKLHNGNYLVCHEKTGLVREYRPNGETAWEYEVPLFGRPVAGGHGPEGYGNQCFAAIRLESGNTLLSTGNGHGVLEVTPAKEIVWQLSQDDLPGIKLAWITSLQVLPSGNIVLNNCHAGESQPQIVEITRNKQVVWTFHDFQRFGNSLTNNQILTTNGEAIVAMAGRDR